MYTNECMWEAIPRQVKAVGDTSKVINQAFLQEETDDVVHAIVLRLGSGCAVKTGGGGARLHNGADDAHHRLKPAERTLRTWKKGKLSYRNPRMLSKPSGRELIFIYYSIMPSLILATFPQLLNNSQWKTHTKTSDWLLYLKQTALL